MKSDYGWIRLACAIIDSARKCGDKYFFESDWGKYLVEATQELLAARDAQLIQASVGPRRDTFA